jgi:hypothetical protein
VTRPARTYAGTGHSRYGALRDIFHVRQAVGHRPSADTNTATNFEAELFVRRSHYPHPGPLRQLRHASARLRHQLPRELRQQVVGDLLLC